VNARGGVAASLPVRPDRFLATCAADDAPGQGATVGTGLRPGS